MGRRSEHPGVEQHGNALRISFPHENQRCRELVPFPPTPAGFAKASKLRSDVLRAINTGTFQYATWFPNSKRGALKSHLFSAVAQEWLDTLELAYSTMDNYERMLNVHWIPILGDKPIADLTPGDLKRAVLARKFKSVKTRNNSVSVLRMVFDYAVGERTLSESPAAKIEHKQAQEAEPDPFTLDEARAILAEMKAEQTRNYFRFAFFSGLRTSELIELQWPNIDLRSGIVRVDAARVLGRRKETKTHLARDVELNAESRAALEAQKALTYLAGGHVFLNPNTGEPYYNQQAPWLALRAVLKKLGIRHRPAYNTRHTFATMNLMAGANPYWVSKQIGHRSLEMTLRVYSKWITGADHGREVGKLDAFLGQSLGQKRAKRGKRE